MSVYNFSQLNQWKFLPIKSVSIVGAGSSFNIENLSKGSSFYLNPLLSTAKDNNGTNRIVAFKFELNAFLSQSIIGDFRSLLKFLSSNEISEFTSSLGESDEMTIKINSIVPAVRSFTSTFKIVYRTEYYGPELQLTIFGIFSIDMLDADKFIFIQNWNS